MENLPAQIGTTVKLPGTQVHVRHSDGIEGFLSYGPHLNIERGSYVAGFHVKRIGSANDNSIVVDVVTNFGATEIAKKRHPASMLFEDIAAFVFVPFTTTDALVCVEVRLLVEQGVAVEVHGLTIFRSDELAWKAS